MKILRLIIFALCVCPFAARAAHVSEFTVASQLLAAARNADVQQVQVLVGNGANINFVDGTGLSLVCTALMNNDLRAAQILQMYGADASKCDQQIRKYRTRNVKERTTGGLFGGLTTAQGMTLAAAGAAVVVGGLFFLTDVFDPENDNGYTGGGSGSGGSGSGGSSGGQSDATALFSAGLPYGPLLPNANAELKNYTTNLSYYAPTDTTSILYQDFQLMNAYGNYLLLMRGYSPLARGYLGMRTLRNLTNYTPLVFSDYKLGNDLVEGGRPVNVALVTANGINAAGNTSLADKLLIWTSNSGNATLNSASNEMVSSKYYNNKIIYGTNTASINDDSTAEDDTWIDKFDFSNSGSVVYNGAATGTDNLLAKIAGGNTAGYSNADFIGFMPNGQMTIYRTGGGTCMVSLTNPVNAGTYTTTEGAGITNGATVNLFGETLTATVSGTAVVLSNEDSTYNGYIGVDGLLYVDSGGDGRADSAYVMSDGTLVQSKELQTNADYYNYSALVNAASRATAGDLANGRSAVDIIANVDVIEPLHLTSAGTIQTVLDAGAGGYKTTFTNLVGATYGETDVDNLPATNATAFFNSLGSSYSPLTIFSTGGFQTSAGWADSPLSATFENSAPLVYQNLEHLFMSIVAVGASTANESGIAANSNTNTNKYQLAQWATPVDANNPETDWNYYKARTCGIAGTGGNGVDPWCFAAVGVTDEMATAAAAGAAGVLRSAFYYMTPKQIFMLLALTADGPFLGRLTGGGTLTESALVSHLQSMYEMPASYQFRIDNGENYLDVFKEVYGYGVINLERATTPGTNLYFYSGGDIVSTSGNAYWRAATSTGFRGSAALNLGRAAISTAAYDILESADGTMRLPRIWKNDFSLGGDVRHGLYMGDVLSDLRVRASNDDNMMRIGKMSFGFARSDRSYDDAMGGMDSMRFEYANDSWKLSADYQRYVTDGVSRFDGAANPILGLASHAVSAGVDYKYGKMFFGARATSGAITDEGLLANDPTISANFEPMKLGHFSAVQSSVGLRAKKFGLTTSVGVARESDTLLGAYGAGLLGLGASETKYFDADAYANLSDDVRVRARATFAHTTPGVGADAIISLSDLNSNAFSIGVDGRHFSFGVSLPLAVSHGKMSYDYADYDIVSEDDSVYDLVVSNAGVRDIDISSDSREVRFNASYRHNFGEFTDGALGFIYRVNPNNTREFGNESIFMLKMSHRLGI